MNNINEAFVFNDEGDFTIRFLILKSTILEIYMWNKNIKCSLIRLIVPLSKFSHVH